MTKKFTIKFDLTTGMDDAEVVAEDFSVNEGLVVFKGQDSKSVAAVKVASVALIRRDG